VRLIT